MTNDCNNLDAFLDDEFAPGESARFAAHLDQCPACREAVDEQQWIDGLLRWPAIAQLESPPPSLVESFRTSLARRLQQIRVVACGLATAAMLLIAVGWTTKLNRQAVGPTGHDVAEVAVVPVDSREPMPAVQPATFVGDPDFIVVPVASRSPNVTIVRVYPAYQPEYSTAASSDEPPAVDELTWPEPFNGG